MTDMLWRLSHRADPVAVGLADRHYSRQKPGTPQFVPPGRCLVLVTEDGQAVWVTSWPFAQYVKHAWAGAWVCSMFRNEGPHLSSELVRQAVAVTRWKWGDGPLPHGMVTFIDEQKTREKEVAGWCYRRAKFKSAGRTKGGLVALRLTPNRMPEALVPAGVMDFGAEPAVAA